jgi:hypothetical protein
LTIMRIELKNPALSAGILACVGLGLALVFTSPYGPGISTDAVNYLATADQVAAGEGFTSFEGGPYVLWPPLYPALLAIPKAIFGLDPLSFGAALNAGAFAVLIFLFGVLAGRVLGSHWFLSTLAAAAALLSTGTLAVSANIGSDALFIVLMLGFFLWFEKYARVLDRASWVGMIVLCGLACLQRYIGATLVLTGFAGIVYLYRAELRRGWIEASAFAGLSSLPLLLWIVRNYRVTGTLIGVRNPSTWQPDQNLQDIAFKGLRWFIPYQLSSQPFFWLAMVVAILGVLFVALRRRRVELANNPPRTITIALIVFSIAYILALMVLTKSVDHKNIPYDDRLYLPVFFSLLLLGLISIRDFIFPMTESRVGKLARTAFFGICALWLLFPANGMYKFWLRCISSKGIAYYNIYNLPTYRDSTVTLHLTQWATDPGTIVYSNYPAAVYLTTRRTVKSLPGRADFFGAATPLQQFSGVWPGDDPSVLVWYEPNTKRNLYTPPELAALAHLQPVFTSDDGAIYQISAK